MKQTSIRVREMARGSVLAVSILAAVALAAGCGRSLPGTESGGVDSSPERVSAHLRYSGYSAADYKDFSKSSTFVAMRDGTELAADVFLPAGGPPSGAFPTIFIFTPYGRSHINPQMTWTQKVALRWATGTWGPVLDYSLKYDVRLFLSHGYAVVAADMRGTGASFGSQFPFSPILADDGKEMIDWIASQSWSNGRVGMTGQSYLGWIQLTVAAKRPKALVCIMPEMIAFEGFTEGVRPGGIDAVAWIDRYSRYLQDLNLNRFAADGSMLPTTPVTDEDHDGDLADEIPLMKDGSFLAGGPPRYADGKARRGFFYEATREHMANVLFTAFARKTAPYFDTATSGAEGGVRFVDGSPGYYLPEIIASGIAVYNVGGWFDGFTKGTTKLYASLQGKAAARLSIAPRFHFSPFITASYVDYLHYDGNYAKQISAERLRFFDFHLKGVRNGFDTEPPVNIYVVNAGWRAEREWPLKRQVVTPFYLASGGLSASPGEDGADGYDVDFAQRSSYGKNEVNRWLMMTTPDGLMDRTLPDKRCLIYQTPVLDRDVEVTGHPVADLWVSSDRTDGDFFVYLTDVDASGRSLYVTEGQLRAGWAKTYPGDDQVLGKFHVQPDLPWHGYRESEYVRNPLAGGTVVELRFDLMPTAWVFRKGHRLRVAVAGADAGNFEMNPSLCSGNRPGDCPRTTISIKHTKAWPSRIELPVIPNGR